jgi:hypothetical protein
MIVDSPHSKFPHLYVIVRLHFPVDAEYPTNSVAAVKTYSSKEAAEHEFTRLNQLNEDTGVRYDVYITRFIE